MKIGKGEALIKAQDTLRDVQSRAEQGLLDQANNGNPTRRGKRSQGAEVDVSLGRLIKSQLGVEQLHAERRVRVEELKTLVQSGQYKPSSASVAEAVGKELFVEIAQSGIAPGTLFHEGEAD